MKNFFELSLFSLFFFLLFLFSVCYPLNRSAKSRDKIKNFQNNLYNELINAKYLDKNLRLAIRNKKICIGMTPLMVFAIYGVPENIQFIEFPLYLSSSILIWKFSSIRKNETINIIFLSGKNINKNYKVIGWVLSPQKIKTESILKFRKN